MKIILVLATIFLFASPVTGEISMYYFGPETTRPRVRARVDDIQSIGHEIEEPVREILVDLNRDGKPETLQKDNASSENGGCEFLIFDGASHRLIGTIFGKRIFVSEDSANDWPVLDSYSELEPSHGSFISQAFDGHEYIIKSATDLYDKSVDDLFEKYKDVPQLQW